MSKGKLITRCGECVDYDYKKHRCRRGCNEGEPQEPFYTDCPLPTVNVGEWISVDERLPEPNEECLVSARVGDQVVIDLGELVQYCDGRIFGWMTTNDWDEGEGCKITHWMPLPEPPKGENK